MKSQSNMSDEKKIDSIPNEMTRFDFFPGRSSLERSRGLASYRFSLP